MNTLIKNNQSSLNITNKVKKINCCDLIKILTKINTALNNKEKVEGRETIALIWEMLEKEKKLCDNCG